jgi:hypothetical protein
MAPLLLNAFRDHLVSQGLARKPASSTPTAHPLWIEAREGVKAPGEGDNPTEIDADLVMGAFFTGGIAPGPVDGYSRHDTIDIWYRAKSADLVFPLDDLITREFITTPGSPPLGSRTNWVMGGLQVTMSSVWRHLQRLGSDEQGFTFIASFLFETPRS